MTRSTSGSGVVVIGLDSTVGLSEIPLCSPHQAERSRILNCIDKSTDKCELQQMMLCLIVDCICTQTRAMFQADKREESG